jgi:hypothetical protein
VTVVKDIVVTIIEVDMVLDTVAMGMAEVYCVDSVAINGHMVMAESDHYLKYF